MKPVRPGPLHVRSHGPAFLLAVLLLVTTACDLSPPGGAVMVPCEDGEGTVVELGPASRGGDRYAEFSSRGGTLWITAQLEESGGFLPDTDRTRIEIGSSDDPPSYNTRTGESDALVLAGASVKAGFWTPVILGPGDYWLWSTAGGLVAIQTCERGAIFDPVPATFPPD